MKMSEKRAHYLKKQEKLERKREREYQKKEELAASTKCTMCGKQFSILDVQEGWIYSDHKGYGSKYDETIIKFSLCADCMDKVTANIIFASLGIDQAKFTWCYAGDFKKSPEKCIEKVESTLDYPIFVKPANAGSSVGISKANDRAELEKAVEIASKEDSRILFEETVIGKEVECAVLGNDEPFASTVGEIAPASEFYDYDAKYNNANSLLFIPARMEKEMIEKVRENAVKAYRAVGCTGLSRVDFFVTEDKRVMLNEINTLPGFTSISMYPKLMEKSGISGSELIEKLIELAFERA